MAYKQALKKNKKLGGNGSNGSNDSNGSNSNGSNDSNGSNVNEMLQENTDISPTTRKWLIPFTKVSENPNTDEQSVGNNPYNQLVLVNPENQNDQNDKLVPVNQKDPKDPKDPKDQTDQTNRITSTLNGLVSSISNKDKFESVSKHELVPRPNTKLETKPVSKDPTIPKDDDDDDGNSIDNTRKKKKEKEKEKEINLKLPEQEKLLDETYADFLRKYNIRDLDELSYYELRNKLYRIKFNDFFPDDKITAEDVIAFIIVTYLLRIFTLYLVLWFIEIDLLKDVETGLIAYVGIYLLIFLMIISLVNVSSDRLIGIKSMFYYFYNRTNYNYSRFIIHVGILLLLGFIPFVIIAKNDTSNTYKVMTEEKKREIYKTIGLISSVAWIVLSGIAVYTM